MEKFVAIDLGAESGRVIVGDLSKIEIIYRFPNHLIRVKDSIVWDILGIFNEIKKGLKKAVKKYHNQIDSMGINKLGVNYILLPRLASNLFRLIISINYIHLPGKNLKY